MSAKSTYHDQIGAMMRHMTRRLARARWLLTHSPSTAESKELPRSVLCRDMGRTTSPRTLIVGPGGVAYGVCSLLSPLGRKARDMNLPLQLQPNALPIAGIGPAAASVA